MVRRSASASVLLMTLAGALAGAGAFAVACADATPESSPSADAGADGRTQQRDARSDDDADDAGAASTCEITRAWFEACGVEGDLTCGPAGFDDWCAENDRTINSEAFRRAERACLVEENCKGEDRRDCEYRHYDGETPTSSQAALVAAYCEACEPADTAGCATRSTKYDPAKGIASVPDVFIAAWELADPIVDEIKTKCISGAPDAGACAAAFAGCAADVYLTRLPDCP